MIDISVIIAVNNGEKYIKETIESLLCQTYSNFEIIVVMNCCSDNTLQILNTFSDKRIQVFQTDMCQLAFNLNYGINLAKGQYIARIDADDVAKSDRFEKQIKCFQENHYDIIGSNIDIIDQNSVIVGGEKYPETDRAIRRTIYYSNPIAHPSVMIRKKVLIEVGGYLNGKMSEDYDLWIRLMRNENIRFYNIQENLISYRVHSSQIKGNVYAYAEIAGFFLREAIHQRRFLAFISSLIYFGKAFLKSMKFF